MRLEYTLDAANDIAALDHKTAKRVMDKIDWFASKPDPLKFAKALKDPRKLYRFRIGPYRAFFFTLKAQTIVLLVLAVKNRKEVYR